MAARMLIPLPLAYQKRHVAGGPLWFAELSRGDPNCAGASETKTIYTGSSRQE